MMVKMYSAAFQRLYTKFGSHTVSMCSDPWRNGSASDSRSEGCVFDSRRVQNPDYELSRALFFWAHLLFRTNPSEFLLVSFCWLCLFLRNDCRVHQVEINSLFELLLVWKEQHYSKCKKINGVTRKARRRKAYKIMHFTFLCLTSGKIKRTEFHYALGYSKAPI